MRCMLGLCLLLAACDASYVNLTRVDARTYDVTAERYGMSSAQIDRARVLDDLVRKMRKACKSREVVVTSPVYEDSFGGYGPIGGEGPMVKLRARVTCP